ncbi:MULTISPECIES: Lrp/AsnC family transcriptional regulator [unclassified Aureispira]|uniref:Lrp/AsnC family transcriptional regulator n=1 Tax=unclassified Aureispira TaxID=2649989 RepID=UPI000696845D|nr:MULTISPECIES: Lrp/AsnC family transcriptional regulator [unclassified Aureispira]WMX12331.1 Lrp/AsnC family transcriptional regulator [Aureispira sp. CCB-E]
MNQIDLKILDMLQSNSGRTAKEMATELSLTTTPVYERIKKLEKAGYIKQYVALLNTDLLHKNIIVFMNITIKDHYKEVRDKFVKSMESLDEVSEFYHTSGSFDFLAKVRFANIKEYRDFLVNEVAAIRNISDIDSQIVLEEIKYSTKVKLSGLNKEKE